MAVLDAKLPAWQASTKAVTPTKVEAKTLEGKAPLVLDGGGLGSVRVLLRNQVKAEQNGLFDVTRNEAIAGTGKLAGEGKIGVGESWLLTRTADADSSGEVSEGMLVPIEDGATNRKTSWIQRTAGPIEVGVTPQTFESLVAGALGAAGGDLTGSYSEPSIAEAVVGAEQMTPEAIGPTALSAGSKELSIQLASPAKRKINSGSVVVEWPGSAEESSTVEVEHGLGIEPKTVNLTAAFSATSTFVFPQYQLNGTTKIKVKGFCPPGLKPGAGTKATISWQAIG